MGFRLIVDTHTYIQYILCADINPIIEKGAAYELLQRADHKALN
jgi:hypothetical protein